MTTDDQTALHCSLSPCIAYQADIAYWRGAPWRAQAAPPSQNLILGLDVSGATHGACSSLTFGTPSAADPLLRLLYIPITMLVCQQWRTAPT